MRLSRPVVVAFSLGVVLGGLGMWLSRSVEKRSAVELAIEAPSLKVSASDENGVRAKAVPAAEPVPAAPGADPEGAAFRATIRARIAAALAEGRRGQEVDAFLDELEATARKQGRVTALEIMPGLAVIDRAFPGDMERSAAFSRRMERLARELGTSDDGPGPTAAVAPETMVMAVANAAPGPARDQLVRRTLSAIDRLPVEQQTEALAALSRATATGSAPASPVSLDHLLEQMRSAGAGEARRPLVRSFMAAASNLPAEEQHRRFRQLEEATARH